MTQNDPRRQDLPYLTKLKWKVTDRFLIERKMIQAGGVMHGHGEGLAYHYKAAICALWPHFEWHRWSHLLLEEFVANDETAVMGPASSGKTYDASAFGLCTFYIWSKGTSIIMSSTTKEGLQLRIWGSIKELHNRAKKLRSFLPGHLIESRYMLTGAGGEDEAKDFRDGIIGVACRIGTTFVGLSNYVGLKNDRVILIADEASLMGRGFLDSIANLRKNPSFKAIFMGNPKDPTDALGVAAEPAAHLGGWAGYDGSASTRTWPTRAVNGKCVQLCGYDSPNFDYPRGQNPHKGLITPEQIENDLGYYGETSLQFSMMNLGVMPRDASSRRVITTLLAEQRQAYDPVIWSDSKTTDVVFVDPAYKGIGGDRCVLVHLRFGVDRDGKNILAYAGPPTMVPIDASSRDQSEEQIVRFSMAYCEKQNVPPANFGFDATFAGTLASSFAQIWSPEVVAVTFGGPPPDRLIREGDTKKENEAYGKMVSALWFASYYLIDAAQLRNASRESIEEAAMREWIVVGNQSARRKDPIIDVEPKKDMKKRTGRSPDLWDSFVGGLELARRRGFSIGGGRKKVINQSGPPDWVKRMVEKQKAMNSRKNLTYA